MAKKFRRLQHISTIPILAAMLLSANPAAAIRNPIDDMSLSDNGADITIPMDTPDSRLRNK